jgi:hypothetical protein
MTYKYGVPLHENTTPEQQAQLLKGGKLNVLQNNVTDCWNKLVKHAQEGKCTCNIDMKGTVSILKACVTGRNLKEEYDLSLKYFQEYKK